MHSLQFGGDSDPSLYIQDNVFYIDNVLVKDTTLEAPNYTDYYPFGMPLPNRGNTTANDYRYAYQGQEKDPETGKEAFQLRLWDGRIGRWLTTDPKGQYASPYLGMGNNNPVRLTDPDGGSAGDDDYVFDENGYFVRIDRNDLPDRLVIENSMFGFKEYFNDPVTDVAAINYNIDEKFGKELFSKIKFIYFIDNSRVKSMMTESGIEPKNWANRYIYAASESNAGKMDFAPYHFSIEIGKFEPNIWEINELFTDKGSIFIFRGENQLSKKAFNTFDAGNFLWGNAMKRLGFSFSTTISAAKRFNPNDTKADINAIMRGYSYDIHKP